MKSQVCSDPLVARCREGDGRAWHELVDRYSRYVWAIAVQGYRLAEHDAEEVLQETFTRTYEHLDAVRSDDALKAWIGQVARRLSVDRLRLRQREYISEEELAPTQVHHETLVTIEAALDVRLALARLPEHCQDVLDRFFVRDESYETISRSLQVPQGTVASRISRCLRRLREALSEPLTGAA